MIPNSEDLSDYSDRLGRTVYIDEVYENVKQLLAELNKRDMECPPHHWLISEPQGITSIGKCKHCGVAKEFKNGSDLGFDDWSNIEPPTLSLDMMNSNYV